MFNKCHIIRWNLSRSIDQGEPINRDLQQHIDQCADCRQFQLSNESLNAKTGTTGADRPNPERSQQIISAVRSASREKPDTIELLGDRARRFALPAAITAAACLILVLCWPKPSAPYKSEIAKVQSDLSRLTAFVRSASEPLRILK